MCLDWLCLDLLLGMWVPLALCYLQGDKESSGAMGRGEEVWNNVTASNFQTGTCANSTLPSGPDRPQMLKLLLVSFAAPEELCLLAA